MILLFLLAHYAIFFEIIFLLSSNYLFLKGIWLKIVDSTMAYQRAAISKTLIQRGPSGKKGYIRGQKTLRSLKVLK
ncbi:MAG: hypothetical protein CSA21_05295 [Deltaproteobacteria bacterium]|nr:MAG: hypothetical protein CSA21_05295 [Deltaproteobacteria bacterium]